MQRAVIKPYIDAIERLGAKVVDVEDTKKSHYRVVVRSGGQTKFFIFPGTSSSHRAVKNMMVYVKRWLREVNNGH